ncbi:hypothetical protein HG531_010304 [Fusarium graminearum]|nr:hypothetical protein HG531_010304 [Fusarium graminearum]
MYSAGYNFGNNAAPSFNNPAPQQQSGAQPAAQQMMYNQQQQFAGMAPQGGFNPGANPQMMAGGPGGMMPNAGMQHMAANSQMAGFQQQFSGNPYGQVVPSSVAPQSFTPNYMMGGGMQGFPMNQGESRDKERFALLLDINHELLYESIQIQETQKKLKKESAAAGIPGDNKPSEEEAQLQHDYLQCMRRLQANLSYMAALADRKPEVKVPPCPAYLNAPPLNLSAKLRPPEIEGIENNIDPVADREERNNSIKDLYSRLQAAFPGFDPKKEPVFRANAQGGQKPGNMMGSQASPTAQRTPKMTNMGAPPMP